MIDLKPTKHLLWALVLGLSMGSLGCSMMLSGDDQNPNSNMTMPSTASLPSTSGVNSGTSAANDGATPTPTLAPGASPTPTPTPMPTATPPFNGTITILPSRTSGTVPLAVYFDQQGSIDHEYQWNFGNGQSAKGFQAAHIYENPGTYTVTLTITHAATGAVTAAQPVTITVSPFQGTTYYIDGQNGNDNNSGLSPQTAWQNPERAHTFLDLLLPNQRPNKRFLLRRGQTFVLSDGNWIGWLGNGAHGFTNCRFGAYANPDGSDDPTQPKPIIRENPANTQIQSIFATARSDDLVVQDLVFEGNYNYVHADPNVVRGNPAYPTYHNGGISIFASTHLVFLRLEIRKLDTGFLFQEANDGLFFHDSHIFQTSNFSIFGNSARYSLQGNRVEYASNSHNHYVSANKGVVRGNTFRRSGITWLSTPPQTAQSPRWYSCNLRFNESAGRLLVSGNTMTEASGSNLCVGHNTITARTQDIVFEKNTLDGYFPAGLDYWTTGGTGGMSGVENVIVRNNAILNPRGPFEISGRINENLGQAFPSRNIKVLNNTFAKTPGNQGGEALNLWKPHPGTENIVIKNNIFSGFETAFKHYYEVYAPPSLLTSIPFPVPGFEMDHNLYNTTNPARTFLFVHYPNWNYASFADWRTAYPSLNIHSLDGIDPAFVSTDPLSPQFLQLPAQNPAVNAGENLPWVRDDLRDQARPAGASHDMGAIESF